MIFFLTIDPIELFFLLSHNQYPVIEQKTPFRKNKQKKKK
jgi:hypothetical protein